VEEIDAMDAREFAYWGIWAQIKEQEHATGRGR
jgi:hypothetical protein